MARATPFLPTEASGEKILRPSFVRDEDERPKVAYNQFSCEVPVISLEGIDDEANGCRGEICRKIIAACENWGLFQVVDHGIDAAVMAEMSKMSRDFFTLPSKDKLRFEMTGGKKEGFNVSSHLEGAEVQNWREMVTYLSYPLQGRDYSQWPDMPHEGWRSVVESYGEELMGLSCKLLGVLYEAMGLDHDSLQKACVEMEQKIMVNFYPTCPQPELTLGLRRHTDPGTITLLLQDQVGGLQATKDGGKTWITVQPIEGAFVVNLGDHTHFLSNGRFKNAEHQAVVNSNCSRLSIATFQYPAPDTIVHPLAAKEGETPIFGEPITYSEMYRRKMAKDIELEKLKRLAKLKGQQFEEKAN